MSTETLAAPIADRRAPPRVAQVVARFAASAVAGIAVTALLAVAVSFALGYRTFAVLSGSMEPAIHGGDAVVDEPIPPRAVRVGDVVTFKDPGRGGKLVTHRVRSVRPRGPTVAMVTKGDANNAVERWTVPADGSIGRVRYRLTGAGRAIALVRGPYGRLLLIALPALLLGLYELNRIWRPRRTR
jgi:signal peptidase